MATRPLDMSGGEPAESILHNYIDNSEAEFFVVVPPFASPDRPSLGATIVADIAKQCGIPSRVFYANLVFAGMVGFAEYRRLCHSPNTVLFGERVFSPSFHGREEQPDATLFPDIGDLPTLRKLAEAWADEVAGLIARHPCRFVGLSSTFEQTLSSLSLARRIKRLAPEKIIMLGGANADGPMGAALARLEPGLDYVFSGEAEEELRQFFAARREGESIPRVVECRPHMDLNSGRFPDYGEYFSQLDLLIESRGLDRPETFKNLHLPYESSRGCWWGQKHHCTFCGLNANGMSFRSKSPDKVLEECQTLVNLHGVSQVVMTDNIMPTSYFSTLLPQLRAAESRMSLFYEQKANISKEKMRILKDAGVGRIQPGIESLCSRVLKLMSKGTSARTNINCLRFARAEGVDVAWNLLCDFPGDEEDSYREMTSLIPLLVHLQPPSGVSPLVIDRFSPYFNSPQDFGISNVRPLPAYRAIYPSVDDAELAQLAYHFKGDYTSAARRSPDVIAHLSRAVESWREVWKREEPIPELRLFRLDEGSYLKLDTRGFANIQAEIVSPERAAIILEGSPILSDVARLSLSSGEIAVVDGAIIPLAVISDE